MNEYIHIPGILFFIILLVAYLLITLHGIIRTITINLLTITEKRTIVFDRNFDVAVDDSSGGRREFTVISLKGGLVNMCTLI